MIKKIESHGSAKKIKKRNDNSFSELESGSNNTKTEPGEIAFVTLADFFDDTVGSESFNDSADLDAGFAWHEAAKRPVCNPDFSQRNPENRDNIYFTALRRRFGIGHIHAVCSLTTHLPCLVLMAFSRFLARIGEICRVNKALMRYYECMVSTNLLPGCPTFVNNCAT